jgi:hypothetical protein
LNPSHIKIEFKNIGTAVLLERHENKLLKTMKAQFLTKKNSNISESSKAINQKFQHFPILFNGYNSLFYVLCVTLREINYASSAILISKKDQATDSKYFSTISRPQSSLTIGIVVGASIWNVKAEPSRAMLEENSVLAALIASLIAQ